MAGFIILSDGRTYAASNWAYDATVRAIAEVLPDTPNGHALRDWLTDQQCIVKGPGLGSVDVRELTPESRGMFLKAAQDAFAVQQARGPVGEGWTPEYWTGWLQRLADLVKMVELAGRGEPPARFNPHMNNAIPPTGKWAGPGWDEQKGGIPDDDWRLTNQEKYLKGVTLCRKRYTAPGPGWDHDHCEFCWAKFMEQDHPDILHEGYTTPDGRRWICDKCFNDFHERFGWIVEE